jgi:hypothetical protein
MQYDFVTRESGYEVEYEAKQKAAQINEHVYCGSAFSRNIVTHFVKPAASEEGKQRECYINYQHHKTE